MKNPSLLEELFVDGTRLFVAKDIASPSNVLERSEDWGNLVSSCKHPLSVFPPF